MKRYVVGDIHGKYKALQQCLDRSGFDVEKDLLICLGDVCDRGPEVRESIECLLQLQHLIYIIGNHDLWALQWMTTGEKPALWTTQGGHATIRSYGDKPVPGSHIHLLKTALPYYILNNRLFVHGGFDLSRPLEEQTPEALAWNRSLVEYALETIDREDPVKLTRFDEVFVGHTPTLNYDFDVPLHSHEVWMLDTGAGWWGRLSIMDIASKQFWQSDSVDVLYPAL